MLTRRLFLGGLLAGTAAPAIVRASSIMPIWVPRPDPWGQTIVGMRLVMDAQRSQSALMAEAFRKFHLDHINNAINPPVLIGADHAMPSSDTTAWSRWWCDDAGRVHVEQINPLETYKWR